MVVINVAACSIFSASHFLHLRGRQT